LWSPFLKKKKKIGKERGRYYETSCTGFKTYHLELLWVQNMLWLFRNETKKKSQSPKGKSWGKNKIEKKKNACKQKKKRLRRKRKKERSIESIVSCSNSWVNSKEIERLQSFSVKTEMGWSERKRKKKKFPLVLVCCYH